MRIVGKRGTIQVRWGWGWGVESKGEGVVGRVKRRKKV